MRHTALPVGMLLLGLIIAIPAHADIIGGVDFPGGAVSFADGLGSFTVGGGGVTSPHLGGFNALGVPNFSGASCTNQSNCTYVSLGDGGSIILQFLDNKLTASGSNALDLWVFEIGPDVEDTFIDISKDGIVWFSVGKVFGSTAGIDIDFYGWTTADQFGYIRLTDDTNEGAQTGVTVGADIDAVGAISTVVTPVPEPQTVALTGAGLLALVLVFRRQLIKDGALAR